ncbi:hypothetical protein B0H19DRAFT_1132670 [Mycena capillaripes]|nr:hypothetical protein B0H19DRAFT_1132670 [Mycena capillaripes]
MPFSAWSQIPPEIAHEIAGHNANDVPSLRAMSLVSRTMRFLAIKHLFSIIHFACPEDFPRWFDMVHRTPTLVTIVKRVKFSEPHYFWLKYHRSPPGFSENQPPSARKLAIAPIPPIIPPLPNVSVVEWDSVGFKLKMAVEYMALFPNVQQLHLNDMYFLGLNSFTNFLGACGSLKVLSVNETFIEPRDGDRLQPGTLNLNGLEELAITDTADLEGEEYLVHLVEHCSPAGLKVLNFGSLGHASYNEPCSLWAMERLLRFAAPSVVNLMIEPTFFDESDNLRIVEMVERLPTFLALNVLIIWLRDNRQAEQVLNVFGAAPNLTKLIFRICLYHEDHDDREEFDNVMFKAFPWNGSESMKTLLVRKFPLIQRIGFHICAPRDSHVHFRRGFRRRMEGRLKERLEQARADVGEYLEIEWLDADNDYNPVVYSKRNGKPPWTVSSTWDREPETEASDCESEELDSDSDSESE